MEESKKKSEEDVKIYDKDMYISQGKIRTIIIIVLVFVMGFVAGYFSNNVIYENMQNIDQIGYNNKIQE